MDALDVLSRLSTAGLKGSVITPPDAGYDQARRVWNGCADRRPKAIVRAAGVGDVQRVVGIAAESGISLAIRGGGHSLPGLSTCDGGIILDLGQLNQVTVDPALRRATVGGGALLGDLDRAGAPHGLVVPAGVVSHTGAGGLTLGGGMGWLSRRFGLTIDCLEAAQLVIAAGDVRRIDAASDPELFWGLRGGGGNFGVVTEFSYRMENLGPVQTRSWTYPPTRVAEALRALGPLAEAAPRTLTCSFAVVRDGLSLTVLQSGPAIDEGLWNGFAHLAGPGTPGPSYSDFVAFQCRNDDRVPWGRRYYARGGFLNSLGDAEDRAILAVAEDLPTEESEVYCLQLGGAVTDVADHATAYSGRSAQWYWIVQPIWDDRKDDGRCLAAGRAGAARMTAVSARDNYVNEQADAGAEIAAQSYGQAKYRRLGALKARLDPANLFRLNQNILPLT